jgi:hypothetical protein
MLTRSQARSSAILSAIVILGNSETLGTIVLLARSKTVSYFTIHHLLRLERPVKVHYPPFSLPVIL